MNPIRLVTKDFCLHGRSEIDFTKFLTALIVGKDYGNDLNANAVGKSTIFKAIEFVLFNQTDTKLDKLVRRGANLCKVILYFEYGGNVYRLFRARTKKGINDLSLHIRTSVEGLNESIFVDEIEEDNIFWKNISSRRTGDTEETLQKITKTNYKMFRNTSHFVQHDLSGLPTLTAEKRKSFLREIFQISIYSKLEKISKEQQKCLVKDLDKCQVLLDELSSLEDDICKTESISILKNSELDLKQNELVILNNELINVNESCAKLDSLIMLKEDKSKSVKDRHIQISLDLEKAKKSLSDFLIKKKSLALEAKNSISNLEQVKLSYSSKMKEFEESKIDLLNNEISSIKDAISKNIFIINNSSSEINELKIPLPKEDVCKHCRQHLSDEHRLVCQNNINDKIKKLEDLIIKSKLQNEEFSKNHNKLLFDLKAINECKKNIEDLSNKIKSEEHSLQSKKTIYKDYEDIASKYKIEVDEKTINLEEISKELSSFNLEEINDLKEKLLIHKNDNVNLLRKIELVNIEVRNLGKEIAILNHVLDDKKNKISKKKELVNSIKSLSDKIKTYDLVINSFSSSGIPNLIIQNVLDDLQNESNDILNRIRPGLQLSFSLEKTRSDGDLDDTLDINYYVNNDQSDYEQLSGAEKVSVSFSLKMGLSFILQKMFGSEMKVLLLDEVDQSFDKSSVDAFADIVKEFQNDFKVLVITHNDRLKDKFSETIVVEKDSSGISSAKLLGNYV